MRENIEKSRCKQFGWVIISMCDDPSSEPLNRCVRPARAHGNIGSQRPFVVQCSEVRADEDVRRARRGVRTGFNFLTEDEVVHNERAALMGSGGGCGPGPFLTHPGGGGR